MSAHPLHSSFLGLGRRGSAYSFEPDSRSYRVPRVQDDTARSNLSGWRGSVAARQIPSKRPSSRRRSMVEPKHDSAALLLISRWRLPSWTTPTMKLGCPRH
jgi:hypothetical protein